jgi:hypothetical protein
MDETPWKAAFLEKAQAIDWAKLRHAYGEASDIPALLEQLISDDETTQEEAFDEFCTNVYHQGSTYSATGFVIPFFIALVNHQPSLALAAKLFYLLGSIYEGHPRHEVIKNNQQEIKKGVPVLKQFLQHKHTHQDVIEYTLANYLEFAKLFL